MKIFKKIMLSTVMVFSYTNSLIFSMENLSNYQKTVDLMHKISMHNPLLSGQVSIDQNDYVVRKIYTHSKEASHPSGNFVAYGLLSGTVILCDLNGNCLAEFQGHSNVITSIEFNQTGNLVLTASRDGSARLWDLAGKCLAELKGHSEWVTSAKFHPSKNIIATASHDDTIRLWDLNGTCLKIISCKSEGVHSIAFNPVKDQLVSGGDNGLVAIWDLDGKCVKILNNNAGVDDSGEYLVVEVFWVTFDNEGNHVAARFNGDFDVVSNDDSNNDDYDNCADTAKLWNIDGECLAVLNTTALILNNKQLSRSLLDVLMSLFK